jgi:para-aminobenzoate synthetase/4-amino-4-deoxychorismate lyase
LPEDIVTALPFVPDQSVLLQDPQRGRWLLFTQPRKVVQATKPQDVLAALDEVRHAVEAGGYAAGYVGYEAAGGLDPAMQTRLPTPGLPLLWFGIYESYTPIAQLPACEAGDLFTEPWQPSITQSQYNEAIAAIKQRIRDGDTYQVNFTLRLHNRFAGDPWKLFLRLQGAQQAHYGAYVRLGRHSICSASPELFFALDEGKVTCKPMKGTVKRGLTNAEDEQRSAWLHHSEKNRAENVMIVDMIRNDLGMVADVGSVEVEELFTVEKYPTVHQMTSTVVARTSCDALDILARMFPCASITGAPKVKTMEIIAGLESMPRGIYTGSIGYVAPQGRSQFNVAIRTVVVDSDTQTAEYGVGGGIVWDSEAADEYAECQTKAAILVRPPQTFDLLETMLWDPVDGIFLLDAHVRRLVDSAEYFGIEVSAQSLLESLRSYTPAQPGLRQVLRVTWSRSAGLRIEEHEIKPVKGGRVDLAAQARPGVVPNLFHKTTEREFYAGIKASQPGLQDVVLWTEHGEVSESTIANVVVRIGDEWVTPMASVGLLPGVFRAHLLATGVVREGVVSKGDFLTADDVYLVNSVRGWMRLQREPGGEGWRIATEFEYAPPVGLALAGCEGTEEERRRACC